MQIKVVLGIQFNGPEKFSGYVLCYSNQGLFTARSEDGSICSIDWVSKCLTVPKNGMNIDLDVVKYSDVDSK